MKEPKKELKKCFLNCKENNNLKMNTIVYLLYNLVYFQWLEYKLNVFKYFLL